MQSRPPQYWKSILALAIVIAWGNILFQGITASLGQSPWRRTSQGWEAAADSRPIEATSTAWAQGQAQPPVLGFKSLGLQIDVESAHQIHRIILPLAIAGLIGSLGFWFLLWDKRSLPT
jgi:hypothetical protein